MSEFINNQSQKEEKLKEIIRQLHEGKTVADVKEAFGDLLDDVGLDEIIRIEEALVNEGLDAEQIKPLCDVHVELFRDSLDDQADPETIPGHPIFTYRAENLGVGHALKRLGDAITAMEAQPGLKTVMDLQEAVTHLRKYESHYLRKENILFSYLERTGFGGPSKVMWAIHDDVRTLWKRLEALVSTPPSGDPQARFAEMRTIFEELDKTIREMIYKEDKILFPAALERLNDKDWAEIRAQSEELGYAYARPGNQWKPRMDPRELEAIQAAKPVTDTDDALIPLSVGALSAAQIDLMLKSLPVDVTFVDANDEVRYFSQTAERIFPRSPAIIGRKVQNCHPPQSLDKVQQIVNDFKAGTRDTAEFWIQMAGMFIHIRYFALRNEAGEYEGTLEVSQNLAPLRELQGEKRLLDA